MGLLRNALMRGPEKIIQLKIKTTKEICKHHGEYTAYHGEHCVSGCPICMNETDEYKDESRRIRERHEYEKSRDVFKRSCVPPKYTRSTFTDFESPTKEAEDIKKKLGKYVMKFDEAKKAGVSYLITGGTGTGKTMLATAVINNIIHRGHTGIYLSTLDFLLRVKRAWTTGSGISVDQVIHEYVEGFDLLVLDDILKGSVTENDKAMIFTLLDRRNQMDKPTIGISIFSEKQIAAKLDPDVIRRLNNGGGETLVFGWKGYEKTREKFL